MKKTIRDYDICDKVVLVRCDFNVPIKNGVIMDDTRIKASLKTLNYCINRGAKIVVFSHLGKVKTEEDKVKNNLYPVSVRLGELLGKDVLFSYETRSDKLTEMLSNLRQGDVLLVQNTRYEDLDGKKESSCDKELARYWASLGDLFINDAYGTCHRAHASNVGISEYLPSGLGFLVNDEVEKLEGIMNDDSSLVVIMGGAKVSDKVKVIENLITKCDKLLIGGGMAYTFIKALGYEVGNSLIDSDSLDFCKEMLEKYGDRIVLPVDSIVSDSLDSSSYMVKDIINFGSHDMGLDIGSKTIDKFKDVLSRASRVIMNGPMGVFEDSRYEKGTREILEYLSCQEIKTLIGGGDSATAVNKLGFEGQFYHVSTGGGATLEYLEGKGLPGIDVINDK